MCRNKKPKTTIRIKKERFYKNCIIDSYSNGNQIDSESDEWVYSANFVHSDVISDSSDDDWIPQVVSYHNQSLNIIWNLKNQITEKVETDTFCNCLQNQPLRSVQQKDVSCKKGLCNVAALELCSGLLACFLRFRPLVENTSEWMFLCVSKYYWCKYLSNKIKPIQSLF